MIEAFEPVERVESAWDRCRTAFKLFRPDGQLNDRLWAEAQIKAGLSELTGPKWRKVRNFLTDPRGLAFLDRCTSVLQRLNRERNDAKVLAWRWWRRHGGSSNPGPSPSAMMAYAVAMHLPLEDAEQAAYDRITAILQDTVRASSAVECMNSVLRMQQSRHRRMTQPMLDLKPPVLELSPIPIRSPEKAVSVPSLGFGITHVRLLDTPSIRPDDLTQELSTTTTAA